MYQASKSTCRRRYACPLEYVHFDLVHYTMHASFLAWTTRAFLSRTLSKSHSNMMQRWASTRSLLGCMYVALTSHVPGSGTLHVCHTLRCSLLLRVIENQTWKQQSTVNPSVQLCGGAHTVMMTTRLLQWVTPAAPEACMHVHQTPYWPWDGVEEAVVAASNSVFY